MKWESATIEEVFQFVQGKEIVNNLTVLPLGVPWDATVVKFTDGSFVACKSEWSGPLSEVTPDIDAEPPSWWIYA